MSDLTIRIDDEADYRDVLEAVAAFNRDVCPLRAHGRRLMLPVTAHDGDVLVGAAGLHRATFRGRHVMVWIWTHPDHRRRGVASAILRAVEDRHGWVWHQDPATADGAGWRTSIRDMRRVVCTGYDEELRPTFAEVKPGKRAPVTVPRWERAGFTPDRIIQLAKVHHLLAALVDARAAGMSPLEVVRYWHTGGATPELALDLPALLTPMLGYVWNTLGHAPEHLIGPDAWREVFDIVGFTHTDPVNFGQAAERPTAPVTLYRGAIPERADGWMWTDELDEARCYATHSGQFHGHVWTVTAPPDRVLATIDFPPNAPQYVIDTRGLAITHVEELLPGAPDAKAPHFPRLDRRQLMTLERMERYLTMPRHQQQFAQTAALAALAATNTWQIGAR